MNRRTFAGIVGGGFALAGLNHVRGAFFRPSSYALGCRADPQTRPVSDLCGPIESGPVRGFRLSVVENDARVGGEVAFALRNVTDERQTVNGGIEGLYGLQKRVGGRWLDVLWTTADGFGAAARHVDPGEEIRWRFPLTTRGFARGERTRTCLDVTPGQYRFFCFGTPTAIGTEFRIRG